MNTNSRIHVSPGVWIVVCRNFRGQRIRSNLRFKKKNPKRRRWDNRCSWHCCVPSSSWPYWSISTLLNHPNNNLYVLLDVKTKMRIITKNGQEKSANLFANQKKMKKSAKFLKSLSIFFWNFFLKNLLFFKKFSGHVKVMFDSFLKKAQKLKKGWVLDKENCEFGKIMNKVCGKTVKTDAEVPTIVTTCYNLCKKMSDNGAKRRCDEFCARRFGPASGAVTSCEFLTAYCINVPLQRLVFF